MIHPIVYVGLVMALGAAVFVSRWGWARYQLEREALGEFEARVRDRPLSVKGVEAEDFRRLYIAAHEPRGALYAGLSLIAALLLTYPAILLLTNLWVWGYRAAGLEESGDQPWFDVGYYPWMFYMFFGLVAVWALCGAMAARLYHVRAPEPFQAALARARGEPLENVVIPPRRPKWSPLRGKKLATTTTPPMTADPKEDD